MRRWPRSAVGWRPFATLTSSPATSRPRIRRPLKPQCEASDGSRAAPRPESTATADKILAMVTKTGTDLKGLRDRAILLLGFAGAFRRSELVALNVEDFEFCDDGIRVTIRKSKTDQEGPRLYNCHRPRLDRLPCRSCADLAKCSTHC